MFETFVLGSKSVNFELNAYLCSFLCPNHSGPINFRPLNFKIQKSSFCLALKVQTKTPN